MDGNATLSETQIGGMIFMPKDWIATRDQAWDGLKQVRPESYRCGYCGFDVSSHEGLTAGCYGFIRICGQCNCPTFFSDANLQIPGPRPGYPLNQLPADIAGLYEEARSSRAANAFTGTVMLCRKLLMHVAVEKQAPLEKNFQEYVQWLIDERYAPRGAEQWVDFIRTRANEANHEITLMDEDDADGILNLTEQLLRNVYELPGSVPTKPALQSKPDSNGS